MTEVPPEFIIATDEEGGRCGQLIWADLLEAFEGAEQGRTREAQEQGCFTRARLNSCKQHHLPWTAKLRKESLDLLLDRVLIVQAAARSTPDHAGTPEHQQPRWRQDDSCLCQENEDLVCSQ
jgi:hypothetical protein